VQDLEGAQALEVPRDALLAGEVDHELVAVVANEDVGGGIVGLDFDVGGDAGGVGVGRDEEGEELGGIEGADVGE